MQAKINEMTALENTKFLEEKERKLKKEIEKIKTKFEIEMNALQLKQQSQYGEFKKSRAVEFDK